MANLSTPAFLNQLKALYPARIGADNFDVLSNPWYIVAAVSFSASNRPEAVPSVFTHVLKDLKGQKEKLLLARRLRDALFKSGLISGYPRAINSLVALHEVMPTDLRDTKLMRNPRTSIEEYERTGESVFRELYGESADFVQGLLNEAYPDMGWFSNTVGYGLTYGFTTVLSPLETCYSIVAALIAGDTPRQIVWHMNNARRSGASTEELEGVRTIAMEVARKAGIQWRDPVPQVLEEPTQPSR